MSEEKKKTSNSKIMSFHIPDEDLDDREMDQFMRESMMKEADELEEKINSDPKLAGIEAPDDMFESIVAELKARGVWEEGADGTSAHEKGNEREAGTGTEGNAGAGQPLYATLSEEDREALELGRQVVQKRQNRTAKRRRRMKILKYSGVAAAVLVLVFGVSMTSDANRRLVKRMWEGLLVDFGFKVNTNYLSDAESIRSKSKEETAAMEDIKEKINAPILDFGYLPEGMEYQGYNIGANGYEAVIFYSYHDRMFYLTTLGMQDEGASYYAYDKEAGFEETIVTDIANLEADIWEINMDNPEKTYVAEIEYKGWRYILNGMLPLDELRNMIKSIIIF